MRQERGTKRWMEEGKVGGVGGGGGGEREREREREREM